MARCHGSKTKQIQHKTTGKNYTMHVYNHILFTVNIKKLIRLSGFFPDIKPNKFDILHGQLTSGKGTRTVRFSTCYCLSETLQYELHTLSCIHIVR